MKIRLIVGLSIGCVVFGVSSVSGLEGAAVKPVSPGDSSGGNVVADVCPTFLWAAPVSSSRIELAVYRVEDLGGRALDSTRIIGIAVPGSARGWTPDLSRCLEPGRLYAWSVRSLDDEGRGNWSEAILFKVADLSDLSGTLEAAVVRQGDSDAQRRDVLNPDVLGNESDPEAAAPLAAVTEPGTVAGALPPDSLLARSPVLGSASLAVDGQVHLGAESDFFRGGELFLADHSRGNLSLGRLALSNSIGSSNTAIGTLAMSGDSNGSRNTAVGHLALLRGTSNTAVGYLALGSNAVQASQNVAVGAWALASNTTGGANVAVGNTALFSNTGGLGNTAVGAFSLSSSESGGNNTAVGRDALNRNQTGSSNTAVGYRALSSNTEDSFNTAVGRDALTSNREGAFNTSVGASSLLRNRKGSRNTAIGYQALRVADGFLFGTGSDNIGLGYRAGFNVRDGNHNILIGNEGTEDDEQTIRIGTDEVHTDVFVSGVFGQRIEPSTAVRVGIDASGKLGTFRSSRRYKEDVRAVGEASAKLMELRPVAFRYRGAAAGQPSPIQYGLIAEEVAQVAPELVVLDAEGRPETVKYHLLSSLLLRELQRLDTRVRELERRREVENCRTIAEIRR